MRRGADDKSAVPVFAFALDDALQPLAFFFGSDLARHPGVIHRWHVNQETAGQRDVAGDAGALFADGLLGDLDQNFLTFFKQIGDQRNILLLVAPRPSAPTAAAAASATLRPAIVSRTRRALGVTSRARRSPNFSPRFRHSNSACFRSQSGFRFRLGLVEFSFGFVFFFVDFFGGGDIELLPTEVASAGKGAPDRRW